MENNKKTRPFFQPEFKADAVKLVKSSPSSLSQIARELGVSDGALRTWVKKSSDSNLAEKPVSPEDQIKQLRKENAELKMEREILKKFAAFWVKETNGR